MANSYSTQDIVKGALQRAGERTDGTSPYHQLALKYVNRVYSGILKGNSEFDPEIREAWRWARQTASILVPGYYNQGTVALTQNSQTVTFTTPPAYSLTGYDFQVANDPTFYTIASHAASSPTATIDFPYILATASENAYYAMPLVRDLASTAIGATNPLNIMRLVEPLRVYVQRVLEYHERAEDMGRIYYEDPIKFWERWPLQLLQNDNPSVFTTLSTSETSYRVRFNRYVTNPIRVDFDYIATQPDLTDSSTSIPLIPRDDRDILETGAAYYLYIDKKQKVDSDNFFALTKAKLLAMKLLEQGEQKIMSKAFAQLTPRLDDASIPYWLIQQR